MLRENSISYSSDMIWTCIIQSWDRFENWDNIIRQQVYGYSVKWKEGTNINNYNTKRDEMNYPTGRKEMVLLEMQMMIYTKTSHLLNGTSVQRESFQKGWTQHYLSMLNMKVIEDIISQQLILQKGWIIDSGV